MRDKKQTTNTEPVRKLEVPGKQTVTMLDYEGQTVVTYSFADKPTKP